MATPNLAEAASLCACGCGKAAPIAQRSNKSKGHVRGQPVRWIAGHHAKRHGASCHADVSPEYRSWTAMRNRCTNPRNRNYRNYGARGIAVCARWESFEAFLADMGPRPPGTSIERLDNNDGYHPKNCA